MEVWWVWGSGVVGREVLAVFRLSVSGIWDWMTCRRRWELVHVEGWEPWLLGGGLVAGRLFHEGVVARLRGWEVDWEAGGLLMRVSEPGEVRARARVGLRLWEEGGGLEEEVEGLEFEFEAEVGGVRWVGRVDGLVRGEGGLWVVERKLVREARWDWFTRISNQMEVYVWFLREAGVGVVGGLWDVVVVPGLRRRVRESLEGYEERLWEEGRVRGGRVVLPVVFSEGDMERVGREVRGVSEEILRGVVVRNPSACAVLGCAYSAICLDSSRAGELGYVRREGFGVNGVVEEV
ncbi:MAG: PD-(D/E)XK nuclease family protein [Thermofilaceae archaeon]